MSFTLISGLPGQLEQYCEADINKAIELGFTAVVFSPAFMVEVIKDHSLATEDKNFYRVLKDQTLNSDEFEQCLSKLWNSGLHIIYMPHLEHRETFQNTNGENKWLWRANILLDDPALSYHNVVIKPFLDFFFENLNEYPNKDIDLVLSAELEDSVYGFPQMWRKYAVSIRELLENKLINFSNKVRLGYNPNWYAHPSTTSQEQHNCNQYNKFIDQLDFFSPSMYPPWENYSQENILNTFKDIVTGLKILNSEEESLPQSLCYVKKLNQLSFNVGEFGVGGNMKKSFSEVYPIKSEENHYMQSRYKLYANVFNLIQSSQLTFSKSEKSYWNFWTRGIFDAFGLREEPKSMPDEKIVSLLKDYRSWQCAMDGFLNVHKASSNSFSISFIISNEPKSISYEVISAVSQKKIKQEKLGVFPPGSHIQTIELSNTKAGTYIIKLLIDDHISTEKIIF